MPYTLKDAQKEYIVNPYVKEFISRKALLISYAINNSIVELKDEDLKDLQHISDMHEKVEFFLSEEDIPERSKMPMKLLAEMSIIPNRLFFIEDESTLSEKEIKDTLELDLFSVENFMRLWNTIITCSNKKAPAICGKFSLS